jgi:hypothetical protein
MEFRWVLPHPILNNAAAALPIHPDLPISGRFLSV